MRKLLLACITVIALAGCGGSGNAQPEVTASTVPVTAPTTQPTTTISAEENEVVTQPQDLLSQTPDTSSAEALATHIGCGYWERPARDTTVADVASALSPYVTEALATSISRLRDSGTDIVKVVPGATTEIRFNYFEVRCSTLAEDSTGSFFQDDTVVEVRIEEIDGAFVATEMVIGALRLPASTQVIE